MEKVKIIKLDLKQGTITGKPQERLTNGQDLWALPVNDQKAWKQPVPPQVGVCILGLSPSQSPYPCIWGVLVS